MRVKSKMCMVGHKAADRLRIAEVWYKRRRSAAQCPPEPALGLTLRANRSATAIEEAAKANTALGKGFPAMIAAMLIVIIIIGFHDEAVDRGVEIDDGTEDAPL